MKSMYPSYRQGYLIPPFVIGQADPAPTPAQQQETFTIDNLAKAIRQVTPSLLVVGIATGASFAIGSYLVSRYIVGGGKRKR